MTIASSTGWGTHCRSEISQDRWDLHPHNLVSNILVLQAAYCTHQAFRHLTGGESVLLGMDNTTAVSYVKRQGRIQSLPLLHEVKPIMTWAQKNLADISTVYVPKAQNIQADFLS